MRFKALKVSSNTNCSGGLCSLKGIVAVTKTIHIIEGRLSYE
jgi:hypothetical protein